MAAAGEEPEQRGEVLAERLAVLPVRVVADRIAAIDARVGS
jgi:hypothetical protein